MRIGGALLGILALGFLQQGARAQSLEDRPVGIFLGYTFSDLASSDPTGGRLHERGLDFGVYVRQNHWLRWRADITAGGGIQGPGDDYELGGPEFTAHAGRAVFFAHALFGRGSVQGGLFDLSRSGFAMAFGGGVDVRLTSWFSLRLIDADYLPSRLTGPAYVGFFAVGSFSTPAPQVTSWNNNSRITFGVVFKAGKKS